MIKISVKGLAKFITATEQGKRKVLRDFKFPDPEGAAQAMYYREARDLIEAHHRHGYASPWLQERAGALTQLAQTMSGPSVVRLRNNARALREYAAFWGDKPFEVLEGVRLGLRYGDVRISVVPDLHVRDKGDERLIKLDFAAQEPDDRVPRIVGQAMFEAVSQSGLRTPASSILYAHVARGRIIRGARLGSRMAGEIQAACGNIEAIWEKL